MRLYLGDRLAAVHRLGQPMHHGLCGAARNFIGADHHLETVRWVVCNGQLTLHPSCFQVPPQYRQIHLASVPVLEEPARGAGCPPG
eukprot:COSAG01_NODE_1325_length_10718_cov_50.476787_3_plen_86_part_00